MEDNKQTSPDEIIVDSRLSFQAALAGTAAPPVITKELCLLEVRYWSFDGRLHQGQLVVNQRLQEELADIFAIIRAARFPVAKVIPVVYYGWSDEASMADNNTSAFNYRLIAGATRLSRHATGQAIDINPRQNPVIYADGVSLPPGAVYAPQAPGTLSPDSAIMQALLSRGWQWGGDFQGLKDYHHLEKLL
ncbi:MAG: M15 family metallopeptidase [Deltaproteobacteria bacterium]|nr:M15 family metallopeptidase [Deltaproteobacteria bacterium]